MSGLTDEEFEQLDQILKQEFSDYYEMAGGKNYRYDHLIRTHRYAKKLMQAEEIAGLDFDPKVVEVAALFHDIGRSKDIEEGYLDPFEAHEGHAQTGAEIVADYVQDFLTGEQLETVKQIIRNHHSGMETTEGKIVKDSDNLGLFGVLNMWRMIHYSSDNERELDGAIDYFWSEAIKQRRKRLEKLYFDVSKRTARKRMTDLQNTMVEFGKEHSGTDIE